MTARTIILALGIGVICGASRANAQTEPSLRTDQVVSPSLSTAHGAEPSRDIDIKKRRAEVEEMILAYARVVSKQYGDPVFSLIVTNEPMKADDLKRRIAEIQKIDNTELFLKENEARLVTLQAQIVSKQAELTDVEQRLHGAQIALQEQLAQLPQPTVEKPRDADNKSVPRTPIFHADDPKPAATDERNAPAQNPTATANSLLNSLGVTQPK